MTDDRCSVAGQIETPIGSVYVTPGGQALLMSRTGELRDGAVFSCPEMSDREIDKAGLTGIVNIASELANSLYG